MFTLFPFYWALKSVYREYFEGLKNINEADALFYPFLSGCTLMRRAQTAVIAPSIEPNDTTAVIKTKERIESV